MSCYLRFGTVLILEVQFKGGKSSILRENGLLVLRLCFYHLPDTLCKEKRLHGIYQCQFSYSSVMIVFQPSENKRKNSLNYLYNAAIVIS